MEMQVQPQFVVKPFKSTGVSLLFALFLGPIGLLYSSVIGSIVMTILFLIAMNIQNIGGILVLLIWVISIFWAVLSTNKYNKKVMHHFGINLKEQSK